MRKLLLLIFLFFPFFTFCQVVVNEYCAANSSDQADNYGEYEDWIELYNSGAAAADITGYYLSDKASNPTKWAIPSLSIPAGGRVIIYASGRDEAVGVNFHTNFKLTQTDPEHIVFSNAAGVILENITMQPNQKNHSRGRTTDGAATWSVFTNPTPNAANTGAMQEYATKPIFDQTPGLHGAAISLVLSSPDAGVTIRYTLDGTTPTTTSTAYSGPINVNATKVIRAKAFSSNASVPASFIETNTYFIGTGHTMAVVSVSGDEIDDLLNGGWMEPEGAFEYFSSTQTLIDEGDGDYNKHGNDSWAYDQRGFDYVSRDQYGYNSAVHDQVFRIKDRTKFQRLIFKPAANDNYPFEDGAHIRDAYVHSLSQVGDLKMDERSFEPCIVYVNGQYWGVYEIREKVDDADFTEYYYNQDENNLQFLKTWGGTWSEYGGPQAQTDWDNLKNYILTNDMSVAANFDYVTEYYNWESLVDYVVMNSYVVCSDWLNWNTAWWRGLNPAGDKKKWRYALWDMDATFGHYINYTGIPDQSPAADPCNADNLPDPGGQGHIPILNALMNNETFRQYYVSRYIDLSNTVFSCEFMIHHLDSLINLITPEMSAQITRWGGTYATWEANVQELRDFINSRCVDLSAGMIDCYEVTGPYELTFTVQPAGSGNIKVNSIDLTSYPFTGDYYGNIDILLKATPQPGFMFDYWELSNHTVSPDQDSANVALQITTTDYIIAHFIPEFAIDLGNDTLICEGDYIVLDAGPADSYHWNDGSTAQLYYVTGPGTYSVTVTEAGATFTDDIVVPVSHASAGNDATICQGNFTTLNGSGGVSYSWTPVTGLSNPNIANPVATPLDTTTYVLTITDASGCHYSDSMTVYVLPPVQISAYANKTNICPGEEVQVLVNLSGGGGPPYTIYSIDGLMVTPPLYFYPLDTLEYILFATDACNSVNSDTIHIYTWDKPEINISADKLSGCQPLEVTFNNMEENSGDIFWWNFGDIINNYSDQASPHHTFLEAGIFDISLKITNIYGCDSSQILYDFIEVYPKPVANFSPDRDIVSVFDGDVYFENNTVGINSANWDFGDEGASELISPVHVYEDIGIYEVEVIVSTEHMCMDTASTFIQVTDEYTFWAPTAIKITSVAYNNKFYIKGNGIDATSFYMAIYDRWGEVVYETTEYDNESPELYGWDGRVKDNDYAMTGVYGFIVKYRTMRGDEFEKAGFFTLLR